MTELDVRDVQPTNRHPQIHEAFYALEPGESLTIINDHEPKPLFYEFQAEVEGFDESGYAVERVNDAKYVATFPKKSN